MGNTESASEFPRVLQRTEGVTMAALAVISEALKSFGPTPSLKELADLTSRTVDAPRSVATKLLQSTSSVQPVLVASNRDFDRLSAVRGGGFPCVVQVTLAVNGPWIVIAWHQDAQE